MSAHFPPKNRALQHFVNHPRALSPNGPYLPKEVPLDPWGNRYEYNYPSEHSYFEIVSYGADGKSGGEEENADIFNWKQTES